MVTPEVRSEIDTGSVPVGAAWISPGGAVATLVVAHGAGAGMDHHAGRFIHDNEVLIFINNFKGNVLRPRSGFPLHVRLDGDEALGF